MRKRVEIKDEESDDLYEQNMINNDSEENQENTIVNNNDSKAKQNKSMGVYKKKLTNISKVIKSKESIAQSRLSNNTRLMENYLDNSSHDDINSSSFSIRNDEGKINRMSQSSKIDESNMSSSIKISYMDADSEFIEENKSRKLPNKSVKNNLSNEKSQSYFENKTADKAINKSSLSVNPDKNDFNINKVKADSLIPNHSWNSNNKSLQNSKNSSNLINNSINNNSASYSKNNNSGLNNNNNNNSVGNNSSNSNFNVISSTHSVSKSTNLSQNTFNNSSNHSMNNYNNSLKNYIDINSCDNNSNNSRLLNNFNSVSDFGGEEGSIISNPLENLSINDSNLTDILPSHFRKHELKIESPYEYQSKIFEKVKDCNSIVFMETGKGKTFISIMLIKHFLNRELNQQKLKSNNKSLNNTNSFLSKNNLLLATPDGDENEIYQAVPKQSMKSKIMQMAQQKNIEKLAASKSGDKQEHKFMLKVVFLVCEVVLVDQQSKVIEQNLDDCYGIKVAVMNSSKKFSRVSANQESFRKFWETHSIFVSTPSIIYKLLSIGYIDINQINLLIFDECHHADGNHPYNVLMNEFYFFHKERFPGCKLPQILGLTASPLKKKIDKDVITTGKKALETLCENLDSVMVIDPEVLEFGNEMKSEDDDIKMLSGNEARRVYREIVNHKSVVSFKQLKEFMLENLFYPFYLYAYDQEFLLNEDESRTKEQYKSYIEKKFDSENLTEYNKVLSQMKDLYEYRKKHYLFAVMEKLQRQIFMLVENLDFNSVLQLIKEYRIMYQNELEMQQGSLSLNKLKIAYSEDEKENIKLEQKDLFKIISIFENFLVKAKRKKIDYTSQRLIQLLGDIKNIIEKDIEFDNDHRVIIFVSNRVVSEMLSKLINEYLDKEYNNKRINNSVKNSDYLNNYFLTPQLDDNSSNSSLGKKYQSVSVVGVNKRKNENSFNPSNSLNKMNENVSKFKKGEAQILVGTSTVEEGIDVRSCDYVIVYTELKTAKSYIQMKGRARRVGAIFSIYTDNPKKMQETIADFVELIFFIRKQFNKNSIVSDFRSNKITKKFNLSEEEGEYFYIESSKAKVTIRNSSILFNEFMQSLQLLDKSAKVVVKYNEQKMPNLSGCPSYWDCTFRLESNLIDVIEFPAGYKTDKSTALSTCYVMLFLFLYQIGKLDDSFKYKK